MASTSPAAAFGDRDADDLRPGAHGRLLGAAGALVTVLLFGAAVAMAGDGARFPVLDRFAFG